MFPDDVWPPLFFISAFISIGMLACLTFTVFSLIFERRAADGATQQRDSSVESYYTFERSFDGSMDDYASGSRRRASIITPRKPLKPRQGNELHAATMGRDFRSKQPGRLERVVSI
ncbi:hypothetical protein ACQKWADRAFT_314124 [Trichoderma austrokoningii]